MRSYRIPIICLVFAAVQGCVSLQPVGIHENVPTSREKDLKFYRVTEVSRQDPGMVSWVERTFFPKFECQASHVGGHNILVFADYFDKSGVPEAATLAKDGNRIFWVSRGLAVAGLAMILVSLNQIPAERPSFLDNPWFVSGVVSEVATGWLLNIGVNKYWKPSIDIFNRELEGRFVFLLPSIQVGKNIRANLVTMQF